MTFRRPSRTLVVLAAALALALAAALALAPHGGDRAVASATSDFYTPPATLPASNGTIIRSTPQNAGPPTARSLANAWTIMYKTTDAVGNPIASTGTVLVPKGVNPATAPIVGFGPGTSGPAFRCAPSGFIDSGRFYEQAAINDMLKAGYAVAMTDYEGYHVNPTTSYIVGKAMGPALIDAVRAAEQLQGAGLSSSAKVVFRGYSQGGGAAMWAGQLYKTYAPELNVVGVVGGGVPADLTQVALSLDGQAGFGFLLDALIGLDHAYPDLKLSSYLNDNGRATVAALEANACTVELLVDYAGHHVSEYTTRPPFLDPPWLARVAENKLGATAIPVPVFQYHGTKDQIVPIGQAQTLRDTYCKLGMSVLWKTYDVDHITGVARGNADALSFIAGRLRGDPPVSSC